MSKLPERIFLRDVDLQDLNWDGAEGDVHAIHSPRSIVITHATPYVPAVKMDELERQVRVMREALEKISAWYGINPEASGLMRCAREALAACDSGKAT